MTSGGERILISKLHFQDKWCFLYSESFRGEARRTEVEIFLWPSWHLIFDEHVGDTKTCVHWVHQTYVVLSFQSSRCEVRLLPQGIGCDCLPCCRGTWLLLQHLGAEVDGWKDIQLKEKDCPWINSSQVSKETSVKVAHWDNWESSPSTPEIKKYEIHRWAQKREREISSCQK